MENNKCKLCKYEWFSRVEDPKQCPRCKRYNWKEVKEESKEDYFNDTK